MKQRLKFFVSKKNKQRQNYLTVNSLFNLLTRAFFLTARFFSNFAVKKSRRRYSGETRPRRVKTSDWGHEEAFACSGGAVVLSAYFFGAKFEKHARIDLFCARILLACGRTEKSAFEKILHLHLTCWRARGLRLTFFYNNQMSRISCHFFFMHAWWQIRLYLFKKKYMYL